MAQNTIQITQRKDKGEHVFICGMTGSGKSQLARFLLGAGNFKRVIVQDGKHEFEAPTQWGKVNEGYGVTTSIEEIPKLFAKFGRVIWKPDVEDLENESNWDSAYGLNSLYEWIYNEGNMVFYDDEAAMSSSSNNYPIVKKRLLKQGRSKGISVWNVTQSPVGVPNDFMREATHAFIFYLNAETDRKKVAGNYGNRILKMADEEENFAEFMFYYSTTKNRGRVIKFNPIPMM